MKRDGIQHMTRHYTWHGDNLVKTFPLGDWVLPPISERHALISRVDAELGHFGVKCTHSLLAPHCSRFGMYEQVRDGLARCQECGHVKTSFSDWQIQLHPLPIQGLFYRWSCNLAGELPHTKRGNVMSREQCCTWPINEVFAKFCQLTSHTRSE